MYLGFKYIVKWDLINLIRSLINLKTIVKLKINKWQFIIRNNRILKIK